jgi:hypothetical protein
MHPEPASTEVAEVGSAARGTSAALDVPELLSATQHLDLAVTAPDEDPIWLDRVQHRLDLVRLAFQAHVEATESADGVYADAARADPRLSHQTRRLVREHATLTSALLSLSALARQSGDAPEVVRGQVLTVLGDLRRHRQRGARLVFEAYEHEIGGEE